MADKVGILYSNGDASAMCLLPRVLDDEAVPLTAAAGDEPAVLFILDLGLVWLHHYLIYLTQWAAKSEFSSCGML